MTKKEAEAFKQALKDKLTYHARVLYNTKDPDNSLRVSGIAQAIKIIEDFDIKELSK